MFRSVLYDEADDMWYDYNIKTQAAHNKKWYPSNLTPLYTMCHHPDITNDTLKKIVDTVRNNSGNFTGGLPSSLEKTNQQWDLPNVWAPLVEIVITALENVENISKNTGAGDLAIDLAQKFVQNVYHTLQNTGAIFEKYNCNGAAGEGGEYDVQEGFGWTNGVTMTLLAKYPHVLTSAASSYVNMFTLYITITLSLLFTIIY